MLAALMLGAAVMPDGGPFHFLPLLSACRLPIAFYKTFVTLNAKAARIQA